MSALANAKQWQRNRALELHKEFMGLAAALHEGTKLLSGLKKISRALNGRLIIAGLHRGKVINRAIKASPKTLYAQWKRWNDGDCTPESLILDYRYVPPRDGSLQKLPNELIAEIQRRCTLSTGGRDKNGLTPVSAIFDWLKRDFEARAPIPGINYDEIPDGADFPFSYRSIVRHAPALAERALGNRGFAAFKQRAAFVSLDYSKLRKCELFTLDDVRLDILCIDAATGKAIEVKCYLLMEVASRYIVSFFLKPKDAIKQEDVDELLAHGLQTPGFGIGSDYTTHIKFERGSVACSIAAQQALEGVTNGRIKIHRTSMNGGVRWIGAPRDVVSGNAAGKAVIESFMRRLHHALIHLPGQIGNKWDNAPANIGYGSSAPGTLIAECEHLAKFAAGFNRNGAHRLKLKLPMLYVSQIQASVRDAIERHNHQPGHDYVDHGKFTQAEVAPGVWKDSL